MTEATTTEGRPKGRRALRRGCLVLFVLAGVVLAFPFLWNSFIERRYQARIVELAEAPSERVAIVFGAAVYANGRLSPMLRDRVETAIALYEAGKVDRLLFSGDNSSPEYNEPGRMLEYALARGVPREAIQPDYAGRRTYDTCYRAHHIFGVQSAILVTQRFHLPRALFTCSQLGIETIGVEADRSTYHPVSLAWSQNREFAARLLALVDVIRREPAPVMGEPIALD